MDTRTVILESALELFSRKGYNGTGIQEIVDRSGVGKPTMYYHFGNKEGVLEAIFQQYLDPFLDKISHTAQYNGDMTKTLTDIFRCAFEYASANPEFYRVFISMSLEAGGTVSNQKIRPYLEKLYHYIQEMFSKGALQHGNMKGREREYTLSLFGVINVYALMVINGESQVTDQMLYRVVHQFMHGIFS